MQEEKTRQTPRAEGGEGARSAAPEARPSLTGGSVVCRWRVPASRRERRGVTGGGDDRPWIDTLDEQ